MSTFRLNCGRLVEFKGGTERVVVMRHCCETEFNERHERAVEDRRRSADAVAVELLICRPADDIFVPDDVQ